MSPARETRAGIFYECRRPQCARGKCLQPSQRALHAISPHRTQIIVRLPDGGQLWPSQGNNQRLSLETGSSPEIFLILQAKKLCKFASAINGCNGNSTPSYWREDASVCCSRFDHTLGQGQSA